MTRIADSTPLDESAAGSSLSAGGDAEEYLQSLRLLGIEALDEETLRRHAGRWGKRKILKAADAVLRIKRSADESGTD